MGIDELQAGHELDVLVAEKVMGWRPSKVPGVWVTDNEQFFGVDERMPEFRRFNPSTDIAAAWQVVEKLELLDYYVLSRARNEWRVDEIHYDDQLWIAGGETAPLAICRAALKVVMNDPAN